MQIPAKKICNEDSSTEQPLAVESATKQPPAVHASNNGTEIPSTTSNQSSSTVGSYARSTDVGNYIGQGIDDCTKKELLENPWVLPKEYVLPFSTRIASGNEKKTLSMPETFGNL